MIHFYRSASIAPGKMGSAMAFAVQIAEHVKKTTGATVQVAVPIGGSPNRVGWSVQYENLAAAEAVQLKLLADQTFIAAVDKAAENFVPGSMQDGFWRVL